MLVTIVGYKKTLFILAGLPYDYKAVNIGKGEHLSEGWITHYLSLLVWKYPSMSIVAMQLRNINLICGASNYKSPPVACFNSSSLKMIQCAF
jgi:hypothetical protein